jgi:DNA-directed RNA polymerase specialized sigma24 family protein
MNNVYYPQTRRLLGMQNAYPQDFVVNDELLLRILRALAHCPLEMRQVFSLRVAVGLSLPPIAATTTAVHRTAPDPPNP